MLTFLIAFLLGMAAVLAGVLVWLRRRPYTTGGTLPPYRPRNDASVRLVVLPAPEETKAEYVPHWVPDRLVFREKSLWQGIGEPIGRGQVEENDKGLILRERP